MKTNIDKLIKISVMGQVSHPIKGQKVYVLSHNGVVRVLPGVGGITYNKRVGDVCVGLAADHVEPGVSVKNIEKADFYPGGYNRAFNALACVGNEALIVSGDAKGKKGIVTGKHGGIEHILIDFTPDTIEKLVIGDKILIKAYGQGLELLDYPEIKVMNIDPELLSKMPIKDRNKKLKIGVTHNIPASIMGSGLGADDTHTGDYDIQLFDKKTIEEYGLEDLRFGDFVAIQDADHSYGRVYKKGAISIGIVVHSDCYISGHGPGVTTILTTPKQGIIEPQIDPKANIAEVLKLR